MTWTSVADLKARLSHYLRLVRRGQTVEVRSHQHPVARIVPVHEASPALVVPPERPAKDLMRLTGVRTKVPVDPLAALLHDRARR